MGDLADPVKFFNADLMASVDTIIGFRGLLSTCAGILDKPAFIANLSASTSRSTHTHKRTVGTVEGAVRAGADGVGFQIHLSDAMEGEMLRDFSLVIDQAERLGMPVLAIAYPRRQLDGSDDNYLALLRDRPDEYTQLVSHAVRVAVELGADIVKTVYTGSADTFADVVTAACGVPVIVAGGPVCPDAEAVSKAAAALSAGAWGVAYGRQIFMHRDPPAMARRLRVALGAAVAVAS
jgi:DhnA family fructose-bisphosphate aldolase class Ia